MATITVKRCDVCGREVRSDSINAGAYQEFLSTITANFSCGPWDDYRKFELSACLPCREALWDALESTKHRRGERS